MNARKSLAGLAGAVLISWCIGAGATPANATITSVGVTPADAATIASAIAGTGANVTSASFDTTTAGGPNGISDAPIGSFFPTKGSTFGILTSGNVQFADDANDSGSTGQQNGGGTVRGDTDQDVTVLKVNLNVPAGANCLSIDFQFLSDEFPEYVGSAYNDAFIAELDTSTWTTSGSTITAPDNFAFDPSGNVISINSTGATAMNAGNASGTTYDGATTLLRAATEVSAGSHTVYLSIFDQGDMAYDSAVFLDNLIVGFTPDPETLCTPGATEQNYTVDVTPPSATNPVGTSHTVTATVSEVGGGATPTGNVLFTASGANSAAGTGALDSAGEATFTYTGFNPGDDNIAACYDENGNGSCDPGEASGSATKTWESGGPTGPTCNGLVATITSSADTVNGTSGDDVIIGGPANQVINGQGGNDTICAGDGNDVVQGNGGNDWLDGEGGMDMVIGGAGNDVEHGGGLYDKVGGKSNDPGSDHLFGDASNDWCYGTASDTYDGSCEVQG